jgi:hypothetical protein
MLHQGKVMTKAFYSFHFANDDSRVGQVRNMGVVSGDQVVDDNSWEQIKKNGDAGIKTWIDGQMGKCDVAIVLVGSETATRKWVDYEIRKAWDTHKPIFGIRIHGLKNLQGEIGKRGPDPFVNIPLQNGQNLSNFIPLYDPQGADSKAVYAAIERQITGWIKVAPKLPE